MRTKRDQLLEEIETLESLYYLVQALDEAGHRHIALLRDLASRPPKHMISRLRTEVRRDIGRIRKETKCSPSDAQIRKLVKGMTTGEVGYINVPKWFIDKYWFANYSCVFPRWPYVPMHAFVQFQTSLDGMSPCSTLVAEGMLFDDAELMWRHVLQITGDGKDFHSRPKDEQRELQSFLRATATAIYRFLEAYLNGIAYNCFQTFHKTIELDDHDLLAEWDSKKKRVGYVPFERKLKDYPVICGRYLERDVHLKEDDDMQLLLGEGKILRDGLTHPSPYTNPKTGELEKSLANIAIKPEQVRRLFRAAARYIRKIETSLGRDPTKSTPWLALDV